VPSHFEPKETPKTRKPLPPLSSLSLKSESKKKKKKKKMEAILIDCVNNSLRHFMYRNSIFMCERLCAEFPSEVTPKAPIYLFNFEAFCLVSEGQLEN
jgi:anaphase-promoting complex subunit 3